MTHWLSDFVLIVFALYGVMRATDDYADWCARKRKTRI